MKKIILAICAIIIVALAIIFIRKTINNKYNYEIEKIEQYQYFIFKENEKYGVIDKNAQKIIEPQYTEVIIPNPRKRYFYML